MPSDHVFVSGNRAIIALVPGLVRLGNNERAPGVTGLVLHGVSSCLDLADALVIAGHDRLKSKDRGKFFYKTYPTPRLLAVEDDLMLTIISPIGKSSTRSMLTFHGVLSWFDLAEHLLEAAHMIRDHERNFKVPVVSSWKQTSGTPLKPVVVEAAA